jgi:hypothetical protein
MRSSSLPLLEAEGTTSPQINNKTDTINPPRQVMKLDRLFYLLDMSSAASRASITEVGPGVQGTLMRVCDMETEHCAVREKQPA